MKDSDRFWRVTPPARRSLERMLGESDAELALGWAIVRSAPLEGKHGGPLCQGTRQVTLSGGTREALLDVLQVRSHLCHEPVRSLYPHSAWLLLVTTVSQIIIEGFKSFCRHLGMW